jgi:hypothetical protein
VIPLLRAGAAFHNTSAGLVIAADTQITDLHAWAVANGYAGGSVTITNNSGVDAWGGMVPGAFPAGVIVTLVNKGFISGPGGNGNRAYEQGDAGNQFPGSPGGTALNASAVSGFSFKVDNQGTIRGGGGGAGGGSYALDTTCCANPYTVGGGGGGGGQGRPGGSGGAGGSTSAPGGTPGGGGGSGSGSAPGAGGPGGQNAAGTVVGTPGAAGGAWGGAGGNGAGASFGGAAGHAVTGNANITWINTGTRLGPVS